MLTLKEVEAGQQAYIQTLVDDELSKNTIKQYTLSIRHFIEFSKADEKCSHIKKECLRKFKTHLESTYKPATANLYITGINGYLRHLKQKSLCVKSLNIQAQNALENCLTTEEYKKMLEVAKTQKNNTVYYVMRALANTGVRVGGLKYFTVDTIKTGNPTTTTKGKVRYIVIPDNICEELTEYCKEKGITEGYIFHAKDPQKVMNEPTLLRQLKKIAALAGVDPRKAFPHNLRHLFARVFLEKNNNNIAELADLLGHTKIETTRIYARTGIEEKRKKLALLDL